MSQSNPLISIVIPLYNRVCLVGETLESIRAQTYPYWEVIVVDDGSDDGSFELVEVMARNDSRIKLMKRSRLPKGGSVCRNIGAEHATGEYLIFLDSDDLLAPFCLEQRLEYCLQFPDQDFLVFPMLIFKEQPYDTLRYWNTGTIESDLARFLRADGVWQTTCPIYHKDSFSRSGGFDEDLPFWQDYEFQTRLLIQNFKYIKFYDIKPDCFNRRHTQASISQEGLKAKKHLLIKQQVYLKLIKMLKLKRNINKEERKAIAAMFYSFAIKWVIQERNLSQGLEVWQSGYEQDVIRTFDFGVGSICLLLKYLQLKANKGNIFFSFAYKSLNGTFLRKYKYNQPSKIYKIKYL